MLAAVRAFAHSSPALPYDRARLTQGLTGDRWTSVRARWPAGYWFPDPVGAGVRVRFTVEPSDGTARVVDLPASGWAASGGFRFTGVGCDGRMVRARLRLGRREGRFAFDLPNCTAPMVPPGATSVGLLVTSGDLRWCAELSTLRAGKRRLIGRMLTPLAICPCEPLPSDTLTAIEQRIFARHGCSLLGCHGRATGQAGLSLARGLAYANLVGVPSTTDPARQRVTPGDAQQSVLWRKVAARTTGFDGVPGLGMPIGDPPLDPNELEALRLWIAAGAPEGGAVAEAQALLDCAH